MLKKSASGVLGLLSYSRTHLYAPLVKIAAALLDGLFSTFPISYLPGVADIGKFLNYSTDPKMFVRKMRAYCTSAGGVWGDQDRRIPVCAGVVGVEKVFQAIDLVVPVE